MAKEYGTVLGTSLGKIPEELWDMPRSIFTMSLIKKTACILRNIRQLDLPSDGESNSQRRQRSSAT